jgi:hypothetical protein
MLAASSETFIDYFNTPSERETQLAMFYKGFALAYIEPEEAICIYESLLRIPNVADDLKFFTNCNLPHLYSSYKQSKPHENDPIPKIIHLLYFGETEFHNFHDRCVRSMLFHMLDYNKSFFLNSSFECER